MSPHLNAEVIRARQLEIAASAAHAHHRHELGAANDRPNRVSTSRARRGAAVAVGLCLALAGTGAATASAGTSQHLTPGQLQSHIRSLEAAGYVPASCRVGSTRLFNPRTHRYATVTW
ncbi:MAG: hypothetical protein ACRDPA_06915 [Solirubrobacteraceae bacterium]